MSARCTRLLRDGPEPVFLNHDRHEIHMEMVPYHPRADNKNDHQDRTNQRLVSLIRIHEEEEGQKNLEPRSHASTDSNDEQGSKENPKLSNYPLIDSDEEDIAQDMEEQRETVGRAMSSDYLIVRLTIHAIPYSLEEMLKNPHESVYPPSDAENSATLDLAKYDNADNSPTDPLFSIGFHLGTRFVTHMTWRRALRLLQIELATAETYTLRTVRPIMCIWHPRFFCWEMGPPGENAGPKILYTWHPVPAHRLSGVEPADITQDDIRNNIIKGYVNSRKGSPGCKSDQRLMKFISQGRDM